MNQPADTSTDAFLRKFTQAWPGGFYEGQPLDPMGSSTYGIYGYNSVLYTVYSACIRPYINPDTVVLEIGPGRGAWSNAFLHRNCRKLYAVDAAPPEQTHFWDYVGKDPRVEYIVVNDLKLSKVPDDSIDFFFSFGTFCHLHPEMCEEYVQSLARKMRRGSRGFLMFADFDKYEQCRAKPLQVSLGRVLAEHKQKVWLPTKLAYFLTWRYFRRKLDLIPAKDIWNPSDGGFGWYHWGVDRASLAFAAAGFEVVEPDIEVLHRDPIIHFKKP